MIPGARARAYLRSVDPGIPRPLARPVRLAYVGLIWLALVLVVGSLAVTQHAGSRPEAADLGFGYPLHYVVVDRSWQWGANGGVQGPFSARFAPWEDSFQFGLGSFLLDWAVLAAALCAPVILYHRRRGS